VLRSDHLSMNRRDLMEFPQQAWFFLHQREAQRLLWHTFFGRSLRAGTGAVEVGGAETFLDTCRLLSTYSESRLDASLSCLVSIRRASDATWRITGIPGVIFHSLLNQARRCVDKIKQTPCRNDTHHARVNLHNVSLLQRVSPKI
jgi:hypothetical protein